MNVEQLIVLLKINIGPAYFTGAAMDHVKTLMDWDLVYEQEDWVLSEKGEKFCDSVLKYANDNL